MLLDWWTSSPTVYKLIQFNQYCKFTGHYCALCYCPEGSAANLDLQQLRGLVFSQSQNKVYKINLKVTFVHKFTYYYFSIKCLNS